MLVVGRCVSLWLTVLLPMGAVLPFVLAMLLFAVTAHLDPDTHPSAPPPTHAHTRSHSHTHAGMMQARNYVSCHDLIPRILCCRDENLERLKKILVDAGKEHAKNSAWAIWMVVEGR